MPDCQWQPDPQALGRMLTDAALPPDVWPESGRRDDAPRVALLTGACGFLGRFVARELLQRTDLRLVCLVREKAGESAADRVKTVLSSVGVGVEDLASRVETLVGDVAEPWLMLGKDDYTRLTQRVDTVYHCAAKVDWIRGYGQLRRTNVGGALSMIRLACAGRAKRLLFVSTVATCFSWEGPPVVEEDTDMLPFIGGMPLGYARSKCVAEALLRQAAERGVPVTVLRPSLISGDSTTGVSNRSDLNAAMIEASVVTGITIDADWLMDCVAVDYVARVMATVPQGASNWLALNLRHERPRHWREVVLWMNLHGYPVRLVDSDTWIRRQFEERGARGTLLYAQRQFFSGRATTDGGARRTRPYEAYLAPRQKRIQTESTHALLAKLGIREAALDAGLLHAYFDDYRRVGLLPPIKAAGSPGLTIAALLDRRWMAGETSVNVGHWAPDGQLLIGTDDGLLSEIAAARERGAIGLRRLRETDPPGAYGSAPRHAVLKAKVSDRLIEDLTVQLAGVCRPELGRLFDRNRDTLGLARCHERELALYELNAPSLARHRPVIFGTLRDPDIGRWALLLEYLPEAEEKDTLRGLRTDDDRMRAILQGLAAIHAHWYGREAELVEQAWLSPPLDTARMIECVPLWRELADFARPYFRGWCGPAVVGLQSRLIASLDQWWPRLQALPATLIHNDFNPRNFVVREVGGEQRLCVYDWELATLGIPQHDLAELLCFTGYSGLNDEVLQELLETSRQYLSVACGSAIDPFEWREGFVLALRHLLISRLALYTLMHHFRPLDFLPRVMGNWMSLYLSAERLAASDDILPAYVR